MDFKEHSQTKKGNDNIKTKFGDILRKPESQQGANDELTSRERNSGK